MHIELWQALVLGALQGVAELFPISSLAQTILLPRLLKWDIDESGGDFLAFVVALHVATALALMLYFWRDWLGVIKGFTGIFTHGKLIHDRQSKFSWLLVVGCLVVGAVGLAAEHKIREMFDDKRMAWIVAAILCFNGFIMLFGDIMKKRAAQEHPLEEPEHQPDLAMHAALVGGSVTQPQSAQPHVKTTEDLTLWQGFWVGASQTLALLPGISRSGVTIVSGLWAGLPYEEASRFTFMLATPVILAAGVKKFGSLLHQDHQTKMFALYASVVAFVAAYLSVAFLMKYFHNRGLWPFAIFCIVVGAGAGYWLKMHP